MIRAPFNFVPLANKVYFPEWTDSVSHDIPFKDGEDGVIELEISNITPLFTRNGSEKDNKEVFSSHITDAAGNKRYFIPGASLKGCFRNVLEVLSFAKMGAYNDDSFGFRYFTTQRKGMPNFMDNMKGVKCGWLYTEGEKYYIKECAKGIQKIRHETILEAYFAGFHKGKDGETAVLKQNSFNADGLYPLIEVEDHQVTYKENKQEKVVPNGKYQIVCTGFMEGKKVEYLFSEELKEPVEVKDEIIKQFETIHNHTPYYAGLNGKDGFLKEKLHKGERIPVFFKMDGKSPSSMGISRMYKFPFDLSVKDAVLNCYSEDVKDAIAKGKRDLPETMFGYIDKKHSLKGRIVFGHAFMNGTVSDNELIRFESVLGQPRASYYPMYVKQNKNTKEIKNYSTIGAQVAGRKRYRVIDGEHTVSANEGNGNENVLTELNLIPAGNSFWCKISLHNLRKVEIGAILSAITFNLTNETYHNIGQAKSFGFGKLKCEVKALSNLRFSVNEYIAEFNKVMSFFLQKECHRTLANDQSLKMLVSIASPSHSVEDMSQMTLDEYEENKDENKFRPLTETDKDFNVLVDEKNVICEFAKDYLCDKLYEAKNLLNSNQWDEARSLLIQTKAFCMEYSIDTTEVEEVFSILDSKEKEWEALNRQEKERKFRVEQLKVSIINDKNSSRNFYDDKQWKPALEKIQKALKDIDELNSITKTGEHLDDPQISVDLLYMQKICIEEINKKAEQLNAGLKEVLPKAQYPVKTFDAWASNKGELSQEDVNSLIAFFKEKNKSEQKKLVRESKYVKKNRDLQDKLKKEFDVK